MLSVVNGNIKITNSDLIKYKVNWFNVCMGTDIFDTGFENKVSIKWKKLVLNHSNVINFRKNRINTQ